jgi:hypothetical protein
MSKRFQLNKEDLIKILKVLGYSTASAVVGTLVVIIGDLDVAPQYLFLLPVVNSLLVSLQKFLTDSQGKLGIKPE